MEQIISQNPLFFAFILPSVTDAIITLIGQEKEYWISGDRKVNEGSPAFYFLKKSPWLYILGSIIWFIFWFIVLPFIRQPFNLFITFLFIAGNSWGSSSWLMRIMREKGYYHVNNQRSVMKAWSIVVLYLCLIAWIASYCFQIYFL